MDFWKKTQEIVNKGIESSKEILGKAKETVKDLGEKGILKLDILKLEKDAEKDLLLLGSKAFEIIVEKKESSVSKDNPDVKKLIEEIINLQKKIDEKEEALKKV